jgi:histidinol dehydrogenase
MLTRLTRSAAIVEEVLANVQQHGDRALLDYAQKFDKVTLSKLYLR